jgi:hypothetical protein
MCPSASMRHDFTQSAFELRHRRRLDGIGCDWCLERRYACERTRLQLRPLKNAKVYSHVAEIRSTFAEGIVQMEISDRNTRVGILQDLVDWMRYLKGAVCDPVPEHGAGAGR